MKVLLFCMLCYFVMFNGSAYNGDLYYDYLRRPDISAKVSRCFVLPVGYHNIPYAAQNVGLQHRNVRRLTVKNGAVA